MANSAELLHGVPVLASLNIDETTGFYTTLGFTVTYKDAHYLIIKRDAVQINFWHCKSRHIAENTSCIVYVQNVDALYAECEALGIVHPNGKIADQPYGLRDFAILDTHGNLIRFAQPLPTL